MYITIWNKKICHYSVSATQHDFQQNIIQIFFFWFWSEIKQSCVLKQHSDFTKYTVFVELYNFFFLNITPVHYFKDDVWLRISLGSRFQFLRVPLMRPDTTTNIRTRTLTQVNTLLTIADSFTPNANKPAEQPQDIYLFEHKVI